MLKKLLNADVNKTPFLASIVYALFGAVLGVLIFLGL